MQINKLLTIVLFILPCTLFPDSYHNINGFYGERAAGLGGAYTAISDDPSGAFYNPAGIGFAYDNSISISASNYRIIEKDYLNVDSPGEAYGQISRNFLPNFIGVITSYDEMKVGFSIVNTINENFTRNDQITIPVYSPTINNYKIYNVETYNQVLFGPSIGYALSEKFSVGGTLYFFEDNNQLTITQLQQFNDSSYVMVADVDNRRTVGVIPILGIQYMPTEKLSLGLSLRQTIVTGRNRLLSQVYADSLVASRTNNIRFSEGTDSFYGSVDENNNIIKRPNPTGEVPQVAEIRAGFAYFANKRFMTSFDIIHTSGYRKSKQQIESMIGGAAGAKVIWYDPEILELTQRATTNFALGIEYYLLDNLSLLLGSYTNDSNAPKIDWADTAIKDYARSIIGSEVSATANGLTLAYAIPAFQFNPRSEYVNNIGYSVGLSWASAKASISLTIGRETGYGTSKIDVNSLAQPLQYSGTSFYIVATSRN
ncbi:MAG: transporter, Ompp1/FadL/TodX family protein [Spirochaetota bacterium]